MHEILFKAKRLNNGEWVEGYYLKDEAIDGTIEHLIFQNGTMHDGKYFHKIDPNTLCQFTGEYDKEANMIWEHDIIVNGKETGIIIYETNYHAFVCLHLENTDLFSFINNLGPCAKQISNDVGCKVIGNKFDNPWLLEE